MFFYVAGANAVGGSVYGYSLPGIVLENVTCEGFESSLGRCSSPPLGRVLSSQCQNPSTDAAGVMCFLRQGIMISVMLDNSIEELIILSALILMKAGNQSSILVFLIRYVSAQVHSPTSVVLF